jgi:hypothetical protein
VVEAAVHAKNQLASRKKWLVEILPVCLRLGGLKLLPCIPRTFPMLFLSPTLRFQKTKIGRGVGPFAKMTSREKRVI